MGILDAFIPLSKTQKSYLESLSDACTKDTLKTITKGVKQKKITIAYERLPVSFAAMSTYPQIHKLTTDSDLNDFIEDINQVLYNYSLRKVFHTVARKIDSILLEYTSKVEGFESVRRACFLQLFSTEPLNVLLMGDKKIGLNELIDQIVSLDPQGIQIEASEMKGGKDSQFIQTNKAILGVTQLESLDDRKLNKLATTLEDRSVSIKEGKKTIQKDADVSVLANATPSGGFFVGKGYDILVKQIPFSQKLLDQFHIIFLIREANKNKFVDVIETKDIDSIFIEDAEKEFMKEYVDFARDLDVEFPTSFEKHIATWSEKIITSDRVHTSQISKSQVLGIVRLAKAHARMHLRSEVNQTDLKVALDLMQTSVEVTN